MQLAKQQQGGDGARQRAHGDGDEAQQQRTQGAEHRHNQQDHPQNGGDAEGRNIPFRLLAGVVAVKHGAARQQLRMGITCFELIFQVMEPGHQLVGLLHIKRRTGQFAVQQIPVIAGIVFGHQPAVHQPQLLAVLRQRQLRAAHQHQRIVLQLFAADARKGGVKLGQDPLGLRLATALQARAGGRVNQAVAVLPEKFSPGLLPGGIHRPFYLVQGA